MWDLPMSMVCRESRLVEVGGLNVATKHCASDSSRDDYNFDYGRSCTTVAPRWAKLHPPRSVTPTTTVPSPP